MINYFITYLDRQISLTEEEKEFLKTLLPVKHYKKGTILLLEGQISQTFYFNITGFVRLFYVKNDEDNRAYFYPENTFVSAYESFVKQIPATLNLQAMEDTTLVEISRESAGKLLAFNSKFEILTRIALENELINHQNMIASLLSLSPEERYYQLLEEYPEIFQRIPQHYIASYIGVKPESLSRIKKRHALRNLNRSQ